MIKVLIADDEMLERAVLAKTLQKNLSEQCEVFQAENGRRVLEIYEREKPQILILDIEMPGITGLQAAEKIREADKGCSIIFLTAFDEFSYAKKAVSVRAMEYLLKPFDEQELMLVVEEAVRQAETFMDRSRKAEKDAPVQEAAQAEKLCDDGRTAGIMEEIDRYIKENYVHDISMQDAAREMNYSDAYFSRMFKQCFGQNFTAYLTGYRVEMAKKLLEGHSVNVKEVGLAVGYQDSGYFTKVFKRITGKSPTEYRSERMKG